MRRINLPSNKHKGMTIYCSSCLKYFYWTKKIQEDEDGKKVTIEPICKNYDKKFSQCPNFEKHKFKTLVHIPGTKKSVTSTTHNTRSYNLAVIEAIEFAEEVKAETLEHVSSDNTKKLGVRFQDCAIEYIDFVADIDVDDHKKQRLSSDRIKMIKYYLSLYIRCLKSKKVNIQMLRLQKSSSEHVGYFHTFLLAEMKYSNRSYNDAMGVLGKFYKWAIKKFELKLSNPFEEVRNRVTLSEKRTISKKEYKALISNITPITGRIQLGGKTKEIKNVYREYLVDGFNLCLYTGLRREEVVELKWNMIIEEDGAPFYLYQTNFKVERKQGDGFNENVAPKIIPVIKGLGILLNQLGYESKKGLDEYLLCPDRTKTSTTTIMANLSKGFGHYYKLLETGQQLELRCLRKTYLTYIDAVLEGNTKDLSSHASDEVLAKYYIDKRIVKKAVQEVVIFN